MSVRGFLAVALLIGATAAHADRALWGPGPHWIARVRDGVAMFESRAVVGVDLNGDGQTDLRFDAAGPTEVARSAARDRTHLDLEIYSMVLTGTIPQLGPFTLTVGDGVPNLERDGPLYSGGTSDEIPGTPALAHDAFELFFRIEVAGLVLHNATPFRVEADIDRLPPIGSEFRLIGPPVPLVTDDGLPVLAITEAVNRIVRPEPRPCDRSGVDAASSRQALSMVAARCGCVGRPRLACSARVLRGFTRSGILNPRCAKHLRVCRLLRAGD